MAISSVATATSGSDSNSTSGLAAISSLATPSSEPVTHT